VGRWTSSKWLACIVIEESARTCPNGKKLGTLLRPILQNLVEVPLTMDTTSFDLVPFLQTLRRKCQALANAFVDLGKLPSSKLPFLPVVVQGEPEAGPQAFNFQSAVDFAEKDFNKLNNQLSSIQRTKASKLLRESKDSLLESIQDFKSRKELHERRIVSGAASAIIWLGELPSKLNPIIQAIMNSIKVMPSFNF
jgi:TATA-binding protein-associated factor